MNIFNIICNKFLDNYHILLFLFLVTVSPMPTTSAPNVTRGRKSPSLFEKYILF